jgi:anti-sigma regulatory factor (Ser/Thr protein kinase)
MSDTIKAVFPSDPKFLECVHSLAEQVASLIGFDGRRRYNLILAVSEGFTNAYLHGNQRHCDRSITVLFEFSEDFLRVSIQDEGILPIDNKVEIHRSLTMSEAISGRGLPLIARFADRVALRYDPEVGNTLTMTVNISGDSGSNDKIHKVEVADGNHIGDNGRVHDPSTEGKT